MNRHPFGRVRGLFLLALMGFTSLASASGSYSTGSGGDQAHQAYNFGRAAFYKQLICSSCPLAQSEPDATKASEIVQQLSGKSDLVQKLSSNELEAVLYYLKRRYVLN